MIRLRLEGVAIVWDTEIFLLHFRGRAEVQRSTPWSGLKSGAGSHLGQICHHVKDITSALVYRDGMGVLASLTYI